MRHFNIFVTICKEVFMGIKVLDCTLRDGAYVVNSFFGAECIKNIIETLSSAGVDIIECGWLKETETGAGFVNYKTVSDAEKYIPAGEKADRALMFDYGRYDIKKLTHSDAVSIIRIAFHKQNLDEISFTAEQVKAKGFKVFLQPSNIKEYNDKDIEKLCRRTNYIGVDASYIVDSFGSMFPEDLDRIMPIFVVLFDKNIEIGFHSHNNIQLSLALSFQFINYMKRDVIVDSTLCGIGRGAGNTKTELLLEYLNRKGYEYNLDYIWQGIEKNILPLYKKYNWEYTPQKALLGIKNLHP